MEQLIVEFENSISELNPEQAKKLYQVLVSSLRSNSEDGVIDVHILNARYSFAKSGLVPLPVENLLLKIKEVRPSRVQFNELLKMISLMQFVNLF